MTRNLVVGIDLGTTFSLAAVMRPDGPQVIPNCVGELLTPSAVHVDSAGRVLVGAAARALAQTEPERSALAFKRDMGTDRMYQLGNKVLTPTELSALVLEGIKADVESALCSPIEEAVVTVPAYFGDRQRRATQDACNLAGLKVERIINEPTAAALAYGLHASARELRAIVLDLGGGTFDVTVLEIMEGVIEIQASAGDTRLGGEDFVTAIVERVSSEFEQTTGLHLEADLVLAARLRHTCELAKCRLSQADETSLGMAALPSSSKVPEWSTRLTRREVESRFEALVERMRAPIQRALRDARASAATIDEVLLVGGATRMPCVARLAAEVFGRLPLRRLPPDEAIALGAAVQASLKANDLAVADMVVTDVSPFSLGIAVQNSVGAAYVTGVFAPVLERGTVLPASRVRTFCTVEDGQRVIKVEVYQGEHALCRDNELIGAFSIPGVPPAAAGEESVDLRFTYDMNGVLEVDAIVNATGSLKNVVIERSTGSLTKAEIAQTRERFRRLKFHPRDALPNLTALARADALHVELVGQVRQSLAQAIVAFRAALDAQDPAQIETTRDWLLQLMTRLREPSR